MEEFLNNIPDYFRGLFDGENIYLTVIVLFIPIIVYFLFFKEDEVIISQEVLRCIDNYDTDQIYEYPNLLTDEECDKIIALSKDQVKRSTVIGELKDNEYDDQRTSRNTFLSNSVDPLMKSIDDRIKRITGINPENYEDLQVVHYQPGQEYKAHWDACDPFHDPRCEKDYKKGGLRFATFILYLNDDMDSGETEFPLMGKKVQPQKGKGVLFFNLNDDLKGRKEKSKHAGLPPTKGEKWMCNKWIRVGKFSL
jgi:prolyl 4-hydroxylase